MRTATAACILLPHVLDIDTAPSGGYGFGPPSYEAFCSVCGYDFGDDGRKRKASLLVRYYDVRHRAFSWFWDRLHDVLCAIAPERPADDRQDRMIGESLSFVGEKYRDDNTYCPYCLRCPGLTRMKLVEPYLWTCHCGAIHDERSAAGREICNV